jgi:peptidoglycan/xylan/chitin deacetylase (PgdA/CDA1 family)
MPALRSLAKTAAAELMTRSGAFRLLRPRADAAAAPLVLGYHRVVEDTSGDASIPAMMVTTAMLERQLEWVGRRYRYVTLDELARSLGSGGPPGPLAAVTFDDGYADVHRNAFPLLRRMGVPAAVFVVSGLVGGRRLQTHDRLFLSITRLLAAGDGADCVLWRLAGQGLQPPSPEVMSRATSSDVMALLGALRLSLSTSSLERLSLTLAADARLDEAGFPELLPLTWAEVAEMADAGVTIGSHARTHALLTQETRESVRDELVCSRRALEERLGRPVLHFAYPDGRFDAGVVEEVAAAGYRSAYTTCHHRDPRHPLLTISRRLLWENSCRDGAGRFSAAVMACQVGGVFDLMGRCRQQHGAVEPPRQGAQWT